MQPRVAFGHRYARIGAVLAVALACVAGVARGQDAALRDRPEPYPVDLEREVGPWHVRCYRLPRPPRRTDTDCVVSQTGVPIHLRQPEDARLVFEIRIRPGGGECPARRCEDIVFRAAGPGGMDMRHAQVIMGSGMIIPLRMCLTDRCMLRGGVVPIDPYLDRARGVIRLSAEDYMLVSVRAAGGVRFVYRFDLARRDEARLSDSDPQREISRWLRLPPID